MDHQVVMGCLWDSTYATQLMERGQLPHTPSFKYDNTILKKNIVNAGLPSNSALPKDWGDPKQKQHYSTYHYTKQGKQKSINQSINQM